METAIRTRRLTKRYRTRPALQDLDLEVPRNVVFGYLGPNGAGKTTTIRLLAGLLRPSAGSAEILGRDTVRRREEAQRHIGYLPGDFAVYRDLTGEQYLRFIGNLRGGVDRSFVDHLAKRLDLDRSVRVGGLSHGNRQKLGIIQAFMHRPDVLILDEPTAGLDPLIQREFLGLVREARDEGRTVFLSSHILDEVEAVADMVAILRHGRLVVVESVENLKARAVRRIDLVFEGPPPVAALRAVPAVREARSTGHTAHLVVEGSMAGLLAVAAPHGVEHVVTHEPNLEEIFVRYYTTGKV
ncbi:ABC transporter ATP-binding protein [Spirilliplanes yamanashiensis]|uniref:ABC transporter ATP-binding protein n=1 Tax=Spirilliplanes yamanashiensis TaxID=42233 RepID=A0A8J4DIS9_9ACTN|nr:ABC transporter ATP-binding protein [Spirilliplanes yamanashiensis]MDP9817261.1 ABC-2 type transport system ATP-binding protein [Spirilliplanes yamanashiensis]GIJ03086.1 ABC transporter ATP-binding protein [Spirilliplanes yamanashiensis]